MNVGDYVVRISYNKDVVFRIVNIMSNNTVKLKGVSYRIMADAPMQDLEAAGNMRAVIEDELTNVIDHTVEKILKARDTQRFTRKINVLHVDGDAFYLKLCLKYYALLNIPVIGEHVIENDQPKRIRLLVEKYNPDVVVLTGHDALSKNYKNLQDLNEYRNSAYFIDAVKRIRNMKSVSSELVIFAGACQSCFESILEAGADYAASPKRTFIHALDPVFLVERIINWPFYQVLPVEMALENTITKFSGLGGYEVMGKCRKGSPIVIEPSSVPMSEIQRISPQPRIKPEQTPSVQERLNAPIFTDTLSEFRNKFIRRK